MGTVYDDINEKELFQRVSEGDELAFRDLYRSFARRMFVFLSKLTGSDDTADEIIQETFLRVWLNRDKLPEIEQPGSWIFRVASNQAHSWMRKKQVADKTARGFHSTITRTTDNSLQETFDLNALKAAVQEAIEEMPEQRRKIYKLHREQNMKVAEIAAELGISSSTVKNSLATAGKYIRERVTDAGYLYWLIFFFIRS